jgi:hypothetical protein
MGDSREPLAQMGPPILKIVRTMHNRQVCHDVVIKFLTSCIDMLYTVAFAFQGCARGLTRRDQDRDRGVSYRDRGETEAFENFTEARPRPRHSLSGTRRREYYIIACVDTHITSHPVTTVITVITILCCHADAVSKLAASLQVRGSVVEA